MITEYFQTGLSYKNFVIDGNFIESKKMEKVDIEKFMGEIWKKYNDTKDVEFLAKACEEAPFFGQKEMAFEIARILRLVKKKINKVT